jgi:hypothetical protein
MAAGNEHDWTAISRHNAAIFLARRAWSEAGNRAAPARYFVAA